VDNTVTVTDSSAGAYAKHMESYQEMEQNLKMYFVCACLCVYACLCVRVCGRRLGEVVAHISGYAVYTPGFYLAQEGLK